VHQFGDLIGDRNPIHRQDNATQLQLSDVSQIVHGMLSASLFSSIFGTLIPGSLYRAQSVTFQTPIYSNEAVVGRVVVKKIKHVRRKGVMVTCDTHIFKNCGDTAMNTQRNEHAIVCISGEATVWIPVNCTS
jgi:3-hydroxybutyryl-CoA dehydratase